MALSLGEMRSKALELLLAVLAAVALGTQIAGQQTPQPPPRKQSPPVFRREITKITADLYRAGNGNWYSLFLVTSEGIILADPISTDFATWLKAQLDQRFPGVPVRYVVYSH